MTLTREQVIEMAKQAGLTDMLRLDSEDSRELSVRRVQSFAALIESATEKRAYTAGRAAGLGEAVVVCEQRARIHSDSADTWSAWGSVTETAGAVSRRDEATNCAAAIEQLKETSK
jgi:hypothetical protein